MTADWQKKNIKTEQYQDLNNMTHMNRQMEQGYWTLGLHKEIKVLFRCTTKTVTKFRFSSAQYQPVSHKRQSNYAYAYVQKAPALSIDITFC